MRREFDLGRDSDELAMSMDKRSMLEWAKDVLRELLGQKRGYYHPTKEEASLDISQDSDLL